MVESGVPAPPEFWQLQAVPAALGSCAVPTALWGLPLTSQLSSPFPRAPSPGIHSAAPLLKRRRAVNGICVDGGSVPTEQLGMLRGRAGAPMICSTTPGRQGAAPRRP